MVEISKVHGIHQTVWPHWGVLAVGANFDRGGIRRVWHCSSKFPHKMAVVKCPYAFRLRRLGQNGCRGISAWHFPYAQNCSSDMSMCISPHKTLGPGDASGIFPVNFHTKGLLWDRPWNALVTLGLSDRAPCGTVRILKLLAQPSQHFGPVRWLSLWRGAHFEMARATLSSLWACHIALVAARC